MNNISFCANLIVNKNLFEKMPEGTPEGYSENLIESYRNFLDSKLMKKLTKGDTIELYREKYRPGFALGIKYTSDKLKEPIESGIYTNKRIPTVNLGEMIYDAMTFIIIKSGIQQRYSKTHKENFKAAAEKLLQEG